MHKKTLLSVAAMAWALWGLDFLRYPPRCGDEAAGNQAHPTSPLTSM